MEYRDELLRSLRDEERFARLTFSSPAQPREAEWLKVVVAPVLMRGERRLRALFQGKRKQVAQMIAPAEVEQQLDALLGAGFQRISLQCTDGDLHVRITSKGKVLATRGKASVPALVLAPHNREKEYPIPAGEPDEFLEKLGIMRNGRVLASMQDKFRQINRFLELLGHAEVLRLAEGPLNVVDCGCGRALLTLAAYHYLRDKRGLSVTMTGVDEDADVIERAKALRDRAGLSEMRLLRERIGDYVPNSPPHVVLSLHACDTASDEAIALAVQWGARLILCAPCCQHELHREIDRSEFRAALRHGILRERLADILTDALRAAVLRVMGYRAEVFEFISPSHTAKNLMIRAEKTSDAPIRNAAAEYLQLRDFWGVKPAIERLLGAPFQKRLTSTAS